MISSFFKRKSVCRKTSAKPAASTPQPESEISTGTSSNDIKIEEMQHQIETLRQELAASQAQNDTKDKHIESLVEQMAKKDAILGRNEGLEDKLASYLLTQLKEKEPSPNPPRDRKTRAFPAMTSHKDRARLAAGEAEADEGVVFPAMTSHTDRARLAAGEAEADEGVVLDVVGLVDRWLLVEGGNLPDVEALLTQYADYCLSFGIPLDRLVIFGAMLHPKLSSYIWKWEFGKQFKEKELPIELEFRPDEPFTKLMEGEAMEYRMKANDDQESPRGCAWFKNDNFQDYYALPIHHRGEFKGGIAWSTKSSQGFLEDHIKVFKKSLISLSTVIRCHTNDLAIKSLLNRLVDEIKEQTMELAQANKSLAEANKKIVRQSESQLRNFAMMSHEIRTPLNCIVGLSNLLLHSDLEPSIRENIEMITGSGDLLLAVVDDVLDYSKLATGKVETIIEPVLLPRIIRAVVASVDIRAKPNGVELRTNLSDDLPSEVETDGRRLQQILYNLLGNAIKFGQEGKVVDFTVDLISRDQDMTDSEQNKEKCTPSADDLLRFTVKDYGKGIDPTEIHKIFQPFQQAATNEPKHGGTGLGLAITRQLVRVLGGIVSVESEYGSWCQFTVLLPKNPERPIITPTQESGRVYIEDSNALSHISMHSSVIDDHSTDDGFSTSDDSSTLSSSSFFSPSQHSTADSSRNRSKDASLKRARRLRSFVDGTDSDPSDAADSALVETRINPPEEGENLKSQDVPIINLEEARKLLALSRGDSQEVVDTCEKPNPSAQVDPGTYVAQESRQDIVPERKPVEFDKVKVLVAEDNKINQKVLHRTLTRLGLQDITIVDNGKEAVDICEKVQFDCIFMDMQMPIMDGLEATCIISSGRKERNERFPKIAFLTAHALQDYQDKAADSGADGFISKPFKIEIIKDLITKFLED